MKNSLCIFQDSHVTSYPGLSVSRLIEILQSLGYGCETVDESGLIDLRPGENPILILNYHSGNFSAEGIEALKIYHASGGNILILGDTPSVNAWYPFRNSQAHELHLTRCSDQFEFKGLSAKGLEILGPLSELEAFLGKRMEGIRTTAYPPDECHLLFDCGGHYLEVSPVIAVERRAPEFFGARLAMIGQDDGSPRENVMGVCSRPLTFDPGFLNPDWPGFPKILDRLLVWLQPQPLALGMDLDPVVQAGRSSLSSVRCKNMTRESWKGLRAEFSSSVQGGWEPLAMLPELLPSAGYSFPVDERTVQAGPESLRVRVCDGERVVAAVERVQYGYLPGSELENGFGFSTFRAFRKNVLDEDFKVFVRRMKAMGAQYVRFAVCWEDTERSEGCFDWSIADQLLELADSVGLRAYFWVFPTARGSGLGEGGVPEWVMREPSIDRDGKPGNFPCIWSPYYRKHYFRFLKTLVSRYREDPRLFRFVFDFGNSDFPYTYHFYGDRGDLFDYSPFEQKAFAKYLEETLCLPLETVSEIWAKPFTQYAEVPVPFSEQEEAWLVYDRFRKWGVHEGIREACDLAKDLAPDKAPPDPPGHGLGAINNTDTYWYEALARNWDRIPNKWRKYTDVHNSGARWGGEAWQVGGCYIENDDALFQSIRLNASYLTIPGPDLGVWEDAMARVGSIRRSFMGGLRTPPKIAIFDRLRWHDFRSLAQLGSRLDQSVDLLASWCRYDCSGYDLMVLPGHEHYDDGKGIQCILPTEADYWQHIMDCVRSGLKVLLFPRTGQSRSMFALRRELGLEEVRYGVRSNARVTWPDSFGGGMSEGAIEGVEDPQGKIILSTEDGRSLLVEHCVGKGAILLAGFDSGTDSLDGTFNYTTARRSKAHSLSRLLGYLGHLPDEIETDQLCVWKQILRRDEHECLLLYSHMETPVTQDISFRSRQPVHEILDLASGQTFSPRPAGRPGWYHVSLTLLPRVGFYGWLKPA